MGDITSCATCGDPRLKLVLDLGSQPLAERDNGKLYPLCVAECRNCGLVQLTYEADREQVFPLDHPYATGGTPAMREHFSKLAFQVAPLLDPGDLIVDIGANDGTFLNEVRRYAPHARLLGVEPTGQAAKLRARVIPAEQDFWSRALARRISQFIGPARVITASNVLAHVGSQHDFMSGVSELLSPDGMFITENHDWASVVNGLQIDTIYHEHLRYYTPATLGYLLEMHGFLVQDVTRIATHGGSFRATAIRRAGGLERRARNAADQLRELVMTAGQAGPVYGVGATTRATGLIHFARIEQFLDRVVELPGSAKIGTNIPGTCVPITSEDDLIADQPPHALILSWHLADTITASLRRKGYEGRFLIPLPEARIVYDQQSPAGRGPDGPLRSPREHQHRP